MNTLFQSSLATRQQAQEDAMALAQKIFALNRRGVFLRFFGESLDVDLNAILRLHAKNGASLAQTTAFLEELLAQNLSDTRVDVGLWRTQGKTAVDLCGVQPSAARDVVLYGFGRIGRVLARLLAKDEWARFLQLRAIVVRSAGSGDLAKRASLLLRDSVHGAFDGSVAVDEENHGLWINGRFVRLIYASDPTQVDYTAYGIGDALLIDNTGKWKDEEGLSQHLQAKGVAKVLLTAPAKGAIKNVVYGVNHDGIGDDRIVSAASCTTNAITPTLKILHDEYGIENGHMETIHAFTNDQNLVDNYHKADRRGRAAPLNMVMTSTGAASAVAKAIPELAGKLSGSSIRVPTPNVSLAILNLNFARAVGDANAVNAFIKNASQSLAYGDQIAYSDSPEAASTDFVGCPRTAIFDAKATIAQDNRATLYLWYDNEMGYSVQALKVAQTMASNAS